MLEPRPETILGAGAAKQPVVDRSLDLQAGNPETRILASTQEVVTTQIAAEKILETYGLLPFCQLEFKRDKSAIKLEVVLDNLKRSTELTKAVHEISISTQWDVNCKINYPSSAGVSACSVLLRASKGRILKEGVSEVEAAKFSERTKLGAGLSATVFHQKFPDGSHRAVKVFEARGLIKAVQSVLMSAPNPYAWNKSAVRTAHLRREVLKDLVEAWFGDKLSVSSSFGGAKNSTSGTFELHTEYVQGRPVSLKGPFDEGFADEWQVLKNEILKPLQDKLDESGFIGSMWQAAFGNPVAHNNFLVSSREEEDLRFHWIDVESAAPALFALNPLKLAGYYIPKSLRSAGKYKQPLFDDVDIEGLRKYLGDNQEALEQKLGAERYLRLEANVAELREAQQQWKSLSRTEVYLRYAKENRLLNEQQVQYFRDRPVRLACKRMGDACQSLGTSSVRAAGALLGKLKTGIFSFAKSFKFYVSDDSRQNKIESFTNSLINEWEQRGQLKGDHAIELRRQLESSEKKGYLFDFVCHTVALVPFTTAFQLTVPPALMLSGVVGPEIAIPAFVFAGSICRTAYAGVRLLTGRRKPGHAFALATGWIPAVGNLAYTVPMGASKVFGDKTQTPELGKFLRLAALAKLGASIPIWGGRDTGLEHLMNRLGDKFFSRWSN